VNMDILALVEEDEQSRWQCDNDREIVKVRWLSQGRNWTTNIILT